MHVLGRRRMGLAVTASAIRERLEEYFGYHQDKRFLAGKDVRYGYDVFLAFEAELELPGVFGRVMFRTRCAQVGLSKQAGSVAQSMDAVTLIEY